MEGNKRPPLKQFSLKCECTLQKNDFLLKLNAKTKLFNVILKPPRTLTIVPFPSGEVLAQYDIGAVRAIHRRFIEQGKLTVDIWEGYTFLSILASDISLDKPVKKELLTHIFISNALKQSLELFIARLTDMIRQIRPAPNSKPKAIEKTEKQEELPKQKPKKIAERPKSRRSMLKQALDQEQKIVSQARTKPVIAKPLLKLQNYKLPATKKCTLHNLPMDTLKMIMMYVGECPLGLRVLSKQFSDLCLSSIKYLKLNDQVDEESFKLLTKGALKIRCRMKNVRDISHFVNFSEQGRIEKHNARWLDFSKWKQATTKNIDQLKGIRLYCLSLPYWVKVPSESFIGLKLVYLKLKGSQSVQYRNANFNDANFLIMVNNCEHLTKISLGCVGSDFLQRIKVPQKMLTIKIGTLELSRNRSQNWGDLSRFSKLQILKIRHLRSESRFVDPRLNFPESLKKLKVGQFLPVQALLSGIPLQVQHLAIAGDHIHNDHMRQVILSRLIQLYLPKLKVLNIRDCVGISLEGLVNCLNIELRTRWEQYILYSSNGFFFQRSIRVVNEKPIKYSK